MDEDSSEYPSLACLEHPAANVPLQNRTADNVSAFGKLENGHGIR